MRDSRLMKTGEHLERAQDTISSILEPDSQFTDDPLTVTRVWASFPMDVLVTWDPEEDEDRELPSEATGEALDKLHALIREDFPNATDIWVECTGWQGDSAQFSPRADDPLTGVSYTDFYEWLDQAQEKLT